MDGSILFFVCFIRKGCEGGDEKLRRKENGVETWGRNQCGVIRGRGGGHTIPYGTAYDILVAYDRLYREMKCQCMYVYARP